MTKIKEPVSVDDDLVVVLEYTLMVDEKLIETSDDSEPIQFIQGQGHVVKGLENALYGLRIGEHKEVIVPPQDGYGEVDPDAFADIPREEFPSQIPLEPGVELQLTNEDGDELEASISSVGKENVRLNFNHPLAGKDLHFTVKVVGLRAATPEELDHGHVHMDQHHH